MGKNVVVSGRVLGAILLAWSLVRVLLARAFSAPTGLPLFRSNYDADRLPPVDPAERDGMPDLSRCIACGRCDADEGERMAEAHGAHPGLMQIVLASSRSMPDYDAASVALDHLTDEALEAKEKGCPTGVPLRALVRFVRTKAAQRAGDGA